MFSKSEEEVMAVKRNYRKEYDNYQGTEEQKKRRASRNAARKIMAEKGKVKKGDGKDVDHTTGNPMNNKKLAVKTKSVNIPQNKSRSCRGTQG
jgi:L-arabinose isomerase